MKAPRKETSSAPQPGPALEPSDTAAPYVESAAEGAAEESATTEGAAPSSRPAGPADERLRLLWNVWRTSTDRDAPTLLQLVNGGRVRRVDVDAVAGYIAVVTEDDTHRAMGVRREWVAPLVAILAGRAPEEVAAMLARGPAKIPAAPPPERG